MEDLLNYARVVFGICPLTLGLGLRLYGVRNDKLRRKGTLTSLLGIPFPQYRQVIISAAFDLGEGTASPAATLLRRVQLDARGGDKILFTLDDRDKTDLFNLPLPAYFFINDLHLCFVFSRNSGILQN